MATVVEAVFLGTGDAFGSGGKRPAAIFLRAAGRPRGILLDAGPGCHAALRQHGLSVGDLAAVVLSHFHGDHFAGLPFLELDARRTGRPERLAVFAPPGGRDRIEALRRCLYREKPEGFRAEIREILPGETVSLPEAAGGGAAVPFPADHQPGAWAFGWKLRFGGRTIVYSGDTAFTDRLVRESGDADLLIQECTSLEALPGHTSHADLRRAAGRITARRVLLVHTGEDVLEARDPHLRARPRRAARDRLGACRKSPEPAGAPRRREARRRFAAGVAVSAKKGTGGRNDSRRWAAGSRPHPRNRGREGGNAKGRRCSECRRAAAAAPERRLSRLSGAALCLRGSRCS